MDKEKYAHIYEAQKKYLIPTYSADLLLVSGKGLVLQDCEGRSYLDFGSGIGVCSLGHCHPAVSSAICEQSRKLMHVSNLYMNEKQPILAEKLIKHCFDGAVFFGNSGAEANEGLIKFARKYGQEKGKYEIIVMKDSFHGRTLATLAATGRDKYRKGFSPDMPGFVCVEYNNIDAVKKAVNASTAAIMLEPIQGEGGVIPAKKEYLQELRKLCDENDILLLFDEVQCGMGRTGFFYAYQGFGVEPDGLSLAKALGNGFPIGAFIVKRKYAGVLGAGTHASTFGGTPLACAAACAVIDTIHDENILANCIKQGHLLRDKLNVLKDKYKSVKEIRGKGLMIGVVLDFEASQILPLLRGKGLLALSAGEKVLRLLPPLIVKENDISRAVNIINSAIGEIEKK